MSRKGHSNLIVGLDIGSTTVRMAAGPLGPQSERGDVDLQILGVAEVPAEGIHKGMISNIEDVVSSISACLEKIERLIGVPVDSVWLGISGLHIMSQTSKGVVVVAKVDSEITRDDIERAVGAARTISTPLNYEVIHVLPKMFNVDGQAGIKDPIGMTGVRLEVDAEIILGMSSQIKNFTKSVYRAGLEIEDVVLSILATVDAVITTRQKELGVVVVNLGGSTTSLAVFEEGNLIHTAVLPLGAENVTNDIAIGLKVPIEIAERVKIEYGDCFVESIAKKEEIDLYDLGTAKHEVFKRYFLGEIIEARMEEIMLKVDQELKKIQRSGLLPAGIIFTGGGAKIPGLVELSKKVMRLPSALGYPLNIASVTEKINDLGFSTAIGLVKWGSHNLAGTADRHPTAIAKGMAGSLFGKLKKGLESLIP